MRVISADWKYDSALDIDAEVRRDSLIPRAMRTYTEWVYPALVHRLGNPGPIRALREQLIPLARGTVLEVGAGSGANFPYYDPGGVVRLYALEPNPGMLPLADDARRRTPLDIRILSLPGERLPLDDGSVDTVVSTFTLCTIGAINEALGAIKRVLKPDGCLIFLENSLAPDPRVRRWQRWWAPIHGRVFTGLRLTRDIPAEIVHAGFEMTRLECGYLSHFPKSWSSCCWGVATKVRRCGGAEVR